MEFIIKKEVTETVKIEPPYYCKDMVSYYKVTESGCLVNVMTRGVIVHDLRNPNTADSIKKAVTESTPCTREEFERAIGEVQQLISCALDREVNLDPIPY